MNKEELKEYIGVTAFSLGHVEKDHFQHIILGAISRKWSSFMVFKGGTALQKIGMITRFSEDLDFTEQKDLSPDDLAATVVRAIEAYNHPVEIDRMVENDRTTGFRVMIQGPLYSKGRGLCSIRLEVSRREAALRSPAVKEIDPPYRDVLPYVVRIMNIDEMASEKVRAILTRDKARDLYDLYILMENDAVLDRDMIERKLEYYDMELDVSKLLSRCRWLSKRWDQELDSLMGTVPDRDTALNRVIRGISTSLDR